MLFTIEDNNKHYYFFSSDKFFSGTRNGKTVLNIFFPNDSKFQIYIEDFFKDSDKTLSWYFRTGYVRLVVDDIEALERPGAQPPVLVDITRHWEDQLYKSEPTVDISDWIEENCQIPVSLVREFEDTKILMDSYKNLILAWENYKHE